MRGSMYKLFVQPILNPCGSFIVIIHGTLSLFKQGVVHFAFGCVYKHVGPYAIRINADETVLDGISTTKVVVATLSEPKSNIAIALLPLVTL